MGRRVGGSGGALFTQVVTPAALGCGPEGQDCTAAGGYDGKRGLSLFACVLCQEEESNSLRRRNLPVHV